MWPYWMMFLIPAVAAVGIRRRPLRRPSGKWNLAWVATAISITLLVGYRYEVGGDWGQYLRLVDFISGETLLSALGLSDPGYMLVAWLSAWAGWDVYGVNLFCGAVFAVGLVSFCLRLPRPWLALAVSVPYLIIVVAMGYSRQGVALGFVLLGLVALQDKSAFKFAVWVIIGATFHKSAALVLPLAALASRRNRYWTTAWIAVAAAIAYEVLLRDSVDSLYENYVEAEYQSEGALVRLLMNALPATILLFGFRRLRLPPEQVSLWRWFAILSWALLIILFTTSASTAVDRVALYMLPLQLVVFAYLPDLMGSRGRPKETVVSVVLLYYGAVLFVWLNFAVHARFWVPYRFLPAELLQ